jgi:phage tail tape-measure protein
MDNDKTKEATTNADPITGAPGAHPVGVGLGAAAGGVAGGIAAGAAVGTVAAGPVGTVVGAAVGAIAGGLGGKAVAEHFDPTTEATSTEPDLRTTTLPHLEKAVGDTPASS